MKKLGTLLIFVLFLFPIISCSSNIANPSDGCQYASSDSFYEESLQDSSLFVESLSSISESSTLETIHLDHFVMKDYRTNSSPLKSFSSCKKFSSFYFENKDKFANDFVLLNLDFVTTVRNFPHPIDHSVHVSKKDSSLSYILTFFEVTDYSIIPKETYPVTDLDGVYNLTFSAVFVSYGCNVTTTDFSYIIYKCSIDKLLISHAVYVYSNDSLVGALFYHSEYEVSPNHVINYFKNNFKVFKGGN